MDRGSLGSAQRKTAPAMPEPSLRTGDLGFEGRSGAADSAENTAVSDGSAGDCAKNVPLGSGVQSPVGSGDNPAGPGTDPDLASVIAVWPTLPADVRAAVLATIAAARAGG